MVLLLYFQRKSSRVSKAVFDVTVMAAVLPVIITVNSEVLTTVCASELIYCFSIHLVLMGIPPPYPAFIGTEFLLLPAWILPDRTSAAFTRLNTIYFSCPSIEAAPLAKTPYRIDGYPHRVGDP